MKLKSVKREVKEQLKILGIEDLAKFVEGFSTNKSLESFVEIKKKIKIKRKDVLLRIQRELTFRDYLDEDKLYFLQVPKTIEELGSIEDLSNTVFSALPNMLLKVDSEMTFFGKSAEEWLASYKEALHKEYYKLELRKSYKKGIDSLDKKFFVNKILEGASEAEKLLSKKVPLYYIYLYPKRGVSLDLQKYLAKYNMKSLQKKTDELSKKVTELYPNLEKITYGSLVKSYFGIDYKEGIRLSKQLRKAKKDFTERELVFFGEAEKWFSSIKGRDSSMNNNLKCSGHVFIDKSSYKIPNNVNSWAFRDSCNNSRSSIGRDTYIVLHQLGFEYVRLFGIYTDSYKKEIYLNPLARAYFVENEEGIAHAGGYTDVEGNSFFHTSYEFWTILLCTLRGYKVNDFFYTEGFEGGSKKYYRQKTDEIVYIYSNLGAECSYTKLATSTEVLKIVTRDYEKIKKTCDLCSGTEKAEPELTFTHKLY